jgi:multidrug resistance efflux pump
MKAAADLAQAKQAYDRASQLFKRTLVPQQTLDDAATTLQSKQASYDLSLQNAKNLRASIQASEASMKLADRQLRDTEIRARPDLTTGELKMPVED